MKPTITLRELNISILTSRINRPISFDLKYLKMEGIISPDWTLSQIPVKTEDFTQFIFTNGIRVILRPNIVTFAEPLKSFLIEKVKVISLVFKLY
ncbi:MAG: hypothetical protein SAQ54_24570 [Oscillatoria sp. PMC 1050.18]|nr:hypothetical protein [Oscillatoria sp. PMC 1050.18]